MQNQHLENIWFKAVIDNPAYIEATESNYFKNTDYQEAFKVVKSFWKKSSTSLTSGFGILIRFHSLIALLTLPG